MQERKMQTSILKEMTHSGPLAPSSGQRQPEKNSYLQKPEPVEGQSESFSRFQGDVKQPDSTSKFHSKSKEENLSSKSPRRLKPNASAELAVLKLSQVNAGPKSLLDLFKALQHNDTVVELDISNKDGFLRNANLPIKVLKKGLCPYLRNRNCVLNTLNLFGCNLGNEGLSQLAQVIIENNSLVVLNIGNNLLTGVQSASWIVKIMSTCGNLQDLNISHNDFGNQGISRILTELSSKNHLHQINLLNLNVNHCGVTQV